MYCELKRVLRLPGICYVLTLGQRDVLLGLVDL